MKLEKKGCIYCPDGHNGWDVDTFMTPHAMLVNNEVIRIYGGVRDNSGISRITYIDVSAQNPGKIVNIADKVILDIGEPGCFDDNGVILGDVIKVNNKLYMYYVGFQHVQKVKFFAFSGLAISENQGETFYRYSQTPILDRSNTGRFGRCIHTVLYENNIFKCFYAVINDWKYINNIPYPVYDIWYTESGDGMVFPKGDNCFCVGTKGNEYRIGRPKVYYNNGLYEMYYTRDLVYYTRDLVSKEYITGYAESEDGIHWVRKDDCLNLYKPDKGFDSEMACYPVKLETKYGTYIFYNGNGMGKTGVGYAKIVD